jgi:hypothetical protein
MKTMLPSPMPACWRQDAAHDILKVEALHDVERNDLFLATHTPITDFAVDGLGASDVIERSEGGLLAALSKPGLRHAFVTVRGEPGSGKSHLIRWLATQWDEPDDIVVLLQRADATLRGSLEQLRQRIPDKYRSIISDISVQQERSDAGRLAEFVSGLETALNPDNFSRPPPDADFCRHYDLSALFRVPRVRMNWDAPKRLLSVLANADGKRNSQVASFTIYDVMTLLNYRADVKGSSTGVERLFNALNAERVEIEDLYDRQFPVDQALKDIGDKIPKTLSFVQALNDRRNDAIRRSLGVSAERLQEILLNLRRALLADGKRLVLLLEDITNFQGLDDRLIDALVVDARTRDDLCPLISVVGLTPTYYDKELKPNYRDRSTHKIALGRNEDGEFVDVTSFTRGDVRVRFAARYLGAVRAGRDRIGVWHADGGHGSPPNVCQTCLLRPGCHETFGHLDGVGLFPFTEQAFANFYEALKPNQSSQTWRTPRGFIQGVLAPTMTRPDQLAAGRYPHLELEVHEGIDRQAIMAPSLLRGHLDTLPVDEPDRARLKRTIMLWGDGTDARLTEVDGVRAFAQVSDEIHQAFGLPWHWADIGSAPAPIPPGVDDGHPAANDVTEKLRNDGQVPTPQQPGAAPDPTGPAPKLPPFPKVVVRLIDRPAVAKPKLKLSTLLDVLVREATVFADDPRQFAPTRKTWTDVVVEMVTNSDLVDLARLDLDREMFTDIFRDSLVKIEGFDAGSHGGRHFVLPRVAWVIDGIVAYAFQRDNASFTDLQPDEQAYHLQRLAAFARRLHPLMRGHLAKRLPKVEGKPRALHEAVSCTLAARAWLRGEIAPTAPLTEQLHAIFRDEGDATTGPNSRVDSWRQALSATDKTHQLLRSTLRDALLLRQGAKGEEGPLDIASTVKALVILQRSLKLPTAPEEPDLDASWSYRRAMTSTGELDNKLQVIQREEPRRIKAMCLALDRALHGTGISERLRLFDEAIREADARLPHGENPTSVEDWKKAYSVLLRRPSFEADCDEIETALDLWEDRDEAALDALTRGERLACAAGTPYAGMADVKGALDAAEKAATDLAERIVVLLGRRPDQARFDELHAFGRRIQTAAARLTQHLQGSVDADAA